MGDIIPDGAPVQSPEAGTDDAYLGIPADFTRFSGMEAGSTARQLARVTEQGAYEGAGWLPRFLYQWGASMGGMEAPEPLPSPMLPPEEYNQRYAPIGNDGKPVPLGEKPMPDAVAKLIGEAKREEIERQNVEARFASAHSWPINLGADMAGFMLDPLRAATAFVPGIGEEAILARFGYGFAARTAARLGAGAVGGAAAQAPISALQYALGQEEDSDYGIRQALRDVAFGAAGNALVHTGLGTAGDVLGRHGLAVSLEAERASIREADAQLQHARISAAVGQMVEGKPVDVEPVMRPGEVSPAELATAQRELNRDGYDPGVSQDALKEMTEQVYTSVAAREGRELKTPEPVEGFEFLPPAAEGARPLPEAEVSREATAEAPEEQRLFDTPQTPEERDLFARIADEEQRLAPTLATMQPEERALISEADTAVAAADKRGEAMLEAGVCLKDSGI